MLVYFEFEDRRMNADVTWPKGDDGTVSVQVTDPRLSKELPTDLFYELVDGNRITFTIENPSNKRLTELQQVIFKRLDDMVR